MKGKSYGIIYCVVNIITGKCYIGQTTQELNERKRNHLYELKHDNIYFHNSIKKYGEDNFEWKVLCECNSKQELDEKEKYYIKELNTKKPYGYNLTDGGYGHSGYIRSVETKKKMSESHKGEKNYWYGKKHSEETKKKISENCKGNKLTDNTIKKIKDSKSKTWKIIYPSGEIKIVCGLKQWCEEIGFSYKGVWSAVKNNRTYKDYSFTKY